MRKIVISPHPKFHAAHDNPDVLVLWKGRWYAIESDCGLVYLGSSKIESDLVAIKSPDGKFLLPYQELEEMDYHGIRN